MLNRQQSISVSPYSQLYDLLIPKDHELRQIIELVDFSFVYSELKDAYCLDDGRNAIDPIQMFKYLFLKVRYNLSDRDLVERAKTDLSFKYFLGLDPESEVIHPSLLTKFRNQRLKDSALLDRLLTKTVEIAITEGVLKSNTIIVDATHTVSRFNPHHPIEALRILEKTYRKYIHQTKLNQKVAFPEKNVQRDLEAEKRYANELLNMLAKYPELNAYKAVTEAGNSLAEALADIRAHQVYSTDEDAKVGHKSKETSFFGYKSHLALSEEGIITGAVISSGEKGDGQYLPQLVEQSEANGVTVNAIVGDRAYSGEPNLKYTNSRGILLFSRLLEQIANGRRDPESTWDFNKDAGMVVCPAGHMAVKVTRQNAPGKKRNPSWKYFMDIEKCKECPFRNGCYRPGAKMKTYSIVDLSPEHSAQKKFQETAYFQERVKERYRIEQKNSEIKNRHGYGRSWSGGIQNMRLQGAMTFFEANIQKIIKLRAEKNKQIEK